MGRDSEVCPTQELVIVLVPQDISRLELRLGLSNSMTGDPYKAKISPLTRKRKCPDQHSPSTLSRKGKIVLLENPPPPTPIIKNCLIWNSKGANNVEFKRHCKSLVGIHQPSILDLLETRMSDHRNLVDELGFPCFH